MSNNQEKAYFVHESSYVENSAKIGKGTKIWYFTHVSENAEIGENCNIGQNVFIDKNVKIGNGVKIQNNVSVYTSVGIEDDVFLGPSCVFTNVINPRSFIERKTEFKETLVQKGASIGANATIVCGNTIGKYALVAAGAVVTKDVSNYTIVGGNPAKFMGYICECGMKLSEKEKGYYCESCKAFYALNPNNQLQSLKNKGIL